MDDQLTQAHYDWTASFCGIPNLSSQPDDDASSGDPNGAQSDQPQASAPAQPAAAEISQQIASASSVSSVDPNSDDYQAGYQDGSSGAAQNGVPRDGDAMGAYDKGYQDGQNAAGAKQSCDPAADPNSPDYQAGYQDGISGNPQNGVPRAGDAMAAYDEGYEAGKQAGGKQGPADSAPTPVDWDHAEEEIKKEGVAIVFWHAAAHTISHVLHLGGGVIVFIISAVAEMECDTRLYRFKCPTCGAVGEPECTQEEAQEDADQHRKLYPDHLPEAVDPLSSPDGATNSVPAAP
jgi:hypothetical protein